MHNHPPCKVVSIDQGNRPRFLQERDQLVVAHLGLVAPIARWIAQSLPPSFDLSDLIGTGNLALIHAATSFRPGDNPGVPFAAYARTRIRHAILDSIRRSAWTNATLEPVDGEIVAPAAPPIETEIDRGRLRRKLATAVAALPANQQAVMSEYYSPELPSLATVAKRLAMPKSRATQHRRDAVHAVRLKIAA